MHCYNTYRIRFLTPGLGNRKNLMLSVQGNFLLFLCQSFLHGATSPVSKYKSTNTLRNRVLLQHNTSEGTKAQFESVHNENTNISTGIFLH